ncbi:hypothetical protein B0H13DRAFT_2321970 [Mycena leptocephala]|nr:hypothetical protein B0H13DRAFT_2321970 [Mycena leptocephala]
MVQLFKILQRPTTDTSLAAKIISTTAPLMNKSAINATTQWQDIKDLMTEISQFCSNFPPGYESLQVLVSAAMLARIDDPRCLENMEIKGQNLEWIFTSLEYVQQLWEESPNAHQETELWDSTTLAVRSLLQFLIFSPLPLQPPLRSLHIISRALSAPGDTSHIAARVFYRAPRNWFLDPTSQPLMQEKSVWSQLGRVALTYSDLHFIHLPSYFSLGEDIAKTAEWKPIIYEDLSTWITAFIHHTNSFPYFPNLDSATFVSVIRSVWVPEFTDQLQLVDKRNESWILALIALANVWKAFQFSPVSAVACLRLARCTVSTSLRVHYFGNDRFATSPIPSNIRAVYIPQLGEALIQAAGNARNTLTRSSPPPLGDMGEEESHNTTPPFEPIAAMLGVLGEKLRTEFEPTSGDVQLGGATKQYKDWKQLREYFEAELDALKELVST